MAGITVKSESPPAASWRVAGLAGKRIPYILIAAFLLSGLLFTYIQFASRNIVDYDGFYHIKMAWLLRTEGMPTRFPWLPFTVIDEKSYADQHTLFHVLQAPFTYIPDLILAAKVSAVFFAAVALTVFAWLLRRYAVPHPLFWMLALMASSAPFLYRMSMPRAPSVALVFQLLCFHFLIQRRNWPLFVVSTLFVLAYNGFPTLITLAGAAVFVFLFTERKVEYRILVAVMAGIIVGLLVNPYVPRNILFLYDHIVPKIFASKYATNVGSEWYPYSSWTLLTLNIPALLAYIGGIMLTNREEWLQDKPRLFSFLVATLYLFLLFKSRRFVEYFPPFAILFLALSCRSFVLSGWKLPVARSSRIVVAGACMAVTIFLILAVRHVREDVRREQDSLAYRGAALWLAQNTPADSIVFHTDWDDFPMLFFYNIHNRYIVGLDADNLRLKDEKFFRLWESITLGKVPDPADDIVNMFQSHYVFTDRQHGDFIRNAEQSGRFSRQYMDDKTIVFRVD